MIYKNNIVKLAKKYFKLDMSNKGLISIYLTPIYKEVLNACVTNDRIIGVGARQAGKTALCCIFSLWYALTFKNKKISIYAYSYRHANDILNRINKAFSSLQLKTKPPVIDFRNSRLLFSNDSSITTYTYDSIENINGDCVICDEMAFSHYADFDVNIFKSIPKVIIMSSANKTKGTFYKIWSIANSENNPDGWKPFIIQQNYNCNKQTISQKRKMIEAIGIDRWKNEFECVFMKDNT